MAENDPNPSPNREICMNDDETFEVVLRDSILRCSICHDFLRCPITTPCGHTFCKHCLVEWLASQRGETHTCPSCRFVFPGSYSRKYVESCKSDILSNFILESTCYTNCPNGCPAMLHPGFQEAHYKACPEALVSCINEQCGCSHKIRRKNLADHLGECRYFHCRARSMGCNKLGKDVEIAKHEQTCRTKCVKDYIDKKFESLNFMRVGTNSRVEEQQSSEQVGAWTLARRRSLPPHRVESDTSGVMNMSISHVNALGSLAHELSEFLA